MSDFELRLSVAPGQDELEEASLESLRGQLG